MIDSDGFRANVGIVLINQKKRVFWAKRKGQNAWQFPQGGVNEGEPVIDALFRELAEEVGLAHKDVEILSCTHDWLYYRLPKKYIRYYKKPLVIGQKQKWFILRSLVDDSKFKLDAGNKPEFDEWRWVSYWYPLKEVVAFKRRVYRKALQEFAPIVFSDKKN